MGILDDAIREHLELKRKHGASGDDVERLEKEAFGPPARPGDPEFADEADETVGEEAEAAAGDWSEVLDENTEDHEEFGSGPGTDSAPVTPAERARIEHTDLDDTVDHPAVPEPGDQPPSIAPEEAEQPAEEEAHLEEAPAEEAAAMEQGPAPPAEQPPAPAAGQAPAEDLPPPTDEGPPEASIFDQSADLDLDLDLDDEPAEAAGTEPPPTPPAAAEEGPGFAPDSAEEDQLEDEDEDLLEETPDFLEDTPEGERLWFEQGEPKDFDFDD